MKLYKGFTKGLGRTFIYASIIALLGVLGRMEEALREPTFAGVMGVCVGAFLAYFLWGWIFGRIVVAIQDRMQKSKEE